MPHPGYEGLAGGVQRMGEGEARREEMGSVRLDEGVQFVWAIYFNENDTWGGGGGMGDFEVFEGGEMC